jgi:hypothetical protein
MGHDRPSRHRSSSTPTINYSEMGWVALIDDEIFEPHNGPLHVGGGLPLVTTSGFAEPDQV